MKIILPLVLATIGGTLLLMGVRSLRAQRLKERYALLFVLLAFPFLGLAVWPDAVALIAQKLNIQYHTVLLLCVTTFFLLLSFKLLSIVSVQERKIAELAQDVALLSERQRESAGAPRSSGRGDG